MDEKLTWNSHISQLCSKLTQNIGILNKLRFLSQDVLKVIYHSFITSHISYCCIIWGFTSQLNLKRIYILQKRAIRIVTHSQYLCPTKPLFVKTKILSIYDMILLNTGNFMFSCYHSDLPQSFRSYFNLNKMVHIYDTRNKNNFHPPLMRTEGTKLTIFYEGPVLWNKLPANIKACKSLKHFKSSYKQVLLDMNKLTT